MSPSFSTRGSNATEEEEESLLAEGSTRKKRVLEGSLLTIV